MQEKETHKTRESLPEFKTRMFNTWLEQIEFVETTIRRNINLFIEDGIKMDKIFSLGVNLDYLDLTAMIARYRDAFKDMFRIETCLDRGKIVVRLSPLLDPKKFVCA